MAFFDPLVEEHRYLQPLIQAIRDENIELLKNLIEDGEDVNAVFQFEDDYDGCLVSRTPIIQAILQDNLKIVQLLVEKYSASVQQHVMSWTPLTAAVSKASTQMVQYLIEKGADVNIPCAKGIETGVYEDDCPLILAIRANRADHASILLEAGARVNVYSVQGLTPLHVAATSVHENNDLVELLLNQGAMVNAITQQYSSTYISQTPLALHLTNKVCHMGGEGSAVTKTLIRHGSAMNDPATQSAMQWTLMNLYDIDTIKLAYKAGLNLQHMPWTKGFIAELMNSFEEGDSTSFPLSASEKKSMLDFLYHISMHPRKLKELCVITVRNSLSTSDGTSILRSIHSLKMPPTISSSLMLDT